MRVKYNLLEGGKVTIESNDVTQFSFIDIESTRIHYLADENEVFQDVKHPIDTVMSAIIQTQSKSVPHAQ